MLKWIKDLLNRLSGVSGAAHVGKGIYYLYDIYRDDTIHKWYFSWFTEDHSKGEIFGPFTHHWEAVLSMDVWKRKMGKGITLVQA